MKTNRKYTNLQKTSKRKKLRNNATPQEVTLWGYLRGSQLGVKFRRQQGIGKYIVDFCCPEKKIIIEIDGSQHAEAEKYDAQRTLYLEQQGYTVLRFWNNEISDTIEGVIMKIQETLHQL